MDQDTFEVTEQHVRLLRAANVGWEDCEFGAPSIDCKRPYGNSSIYQDIAKILDITPVNERAEEFNDEQTALMDKLHRETQTALQIFLATGEMKAGKYVAPKYSNEWKRQESKGA